MIVVIADDLSGAAELANVALQAGLSAHVQLRFDATSDADVSASARHSVTRCVGGGLNRRRTDASSRDRIAGFLYKKCDSLLRGWVAEEAHVMARVLGRTRILLVPANQADSGSFITACTSSVTRRWQNRPSPLIRSSTAFVACRDLVDVEHGMRFPTSHRSMTSVITRSPSTIRPLPVGCADFFTALLDIRGLTPRLRREFLRQMVRRFSSTGARRRG
jgi:hypothetical protein